MTQSGKLRALLRAQGMVIAPGAYDGLTAMLVAQAGFPAVYMTGAGTSVSHGYPDFGLLTETEMVANAARMARAVDVPVIADADTGYGNELNVVRTVHDYENIIARLRAVPAYVDQNIGILDEAIASRIMQSRVVADLVIGRIFWNHRRDDGLRDRLRAPQPPAQVAPRRALTDAQQQHVRQQRNAQGKQDGWIAASHRGHTTMLIRSGE